MQRREDERREMPDRLLWTELAQAAAGKTAPDGERQRHPFPVENRSGPHRRAGVRTCNQTREKRSLEREIRGIVIEQEPCGHAGRERNPEAERKRQAVGPEPPLENEDVPEPAIA